MPPLTPAPNRQHGVAAPSDLPVVTVGTRDPHDYRRAIPGLNAPCRSKSEVAHEIRVRAHLGEITSAKADEQLAALGVAPDPVAEEAARIAADARRKRQAGQPLTSESRYAGKARAGRMGR